MYDGKAIRGLLALIDDGRIESDFTVLLMHLGGSATVHAYANQFGALLFHSSVESGMCNLLLQLVFLDDVGRI